MKQNGVESTELPNAIVGDLDSISLDTRKHYEGLNVTVIEDPDQYSTDFTKCLRYLKANIQSVLSVSCSTSPRFTGTHQTHSHDGEPCLDVLVLGGLGGRVDQAFSQIHHLYSASLSPASAADRPTGGLYLISEESITFLLHEGENTILTPGGSLLDAQPRRESAPGSKVHGCSDEETLVSSTVQQCYLSENVGIIPVGGPSVINTKGFEWDVHDWKTEFGGQVSTSNHIRADMVEVITTKPVLFTVELANWLKFAGKRV
ncbi:predicted protein [Uncinocarpus reesii 1704]|uniref:Thiamine pyrophosphokinase n=1 Tax=Uncinocarpus reesii (strain UAMH 1704) TaxID=336963 RepID=C4JXL0_UNCRE|nr:uncharacterized protein UREG_06383 [Uncinocarpus reesii 1704]EEP81518.1 predicted protein [Uncinocarpus reesii 1704]